MNMETNPNNLYRIQDSDRPMWVVAETYGQAVQRWKVQIALENNQQPSDVTDPQGVELVCESNSLLDSEPAGEAVQTMGYPLTPIVDAAVDLCAFSKTNGYPTNGSVAFYRMGELLDRLETELSKLRLFSTVDSLMRQVPVEPSVSTHPTKLPVQP